MADLFELSVSEMHNDPYIQILFSKYINLFCFSKEVFFDKIGNLGGGGLEMPDLNVHALSF